MNEFELIRRFFNRSDNDRQVRLGVGDDAALIAPTPGAVLVISTDTLNEGRHFFADVAPQKLGHKVLAVNLSDMAAMGATPRWALLSGSLPDSDPAWLGAFAEGFNALADRFGVSLVGGDTVQGQRSFTVTILGEVPEMQAIRRSGARIGDDIWVSGSLGDAALALAALTGRTALPPKTLDELRARLEMPEPRIALGIALRGIATAALDISDGLSGDLNHILELSQVGATVEIAQLPCHSALQDLLTGEQRLLALQCLIAGGDDYELCFTAPPQQRDRLNKLADALQLPLTRIGTINEGKTLIVRDENGLALAKVPGGYDHFGG